VHWNLSDYAKALEYYGKALSIAEELGNKAEVATWLGNIGVVHRNLSNYPKALEYLGKALSIDEVFGNKAGVATWLGNIGTVHRYLSDYAKALEYMGKALSTADELGNKAGVAGSLGNIDSTYATVTYQGFDAVKAETYLLKAVDIATEIGAKAQLVELYKGLSELYEHEQQVAEAFEYYRKHIEIEKELNLEEVKKQESIREQRKQIEIAKATADAKHKATEQLLNKTLPQTISKRLMKGEKNIADRFESVTILFADIVGFTPLSARKQPREMVELLNKLFSSFDRITEQYGVERIKTIGDAYMIVAGAPTIVEDHAQRMAQVAFAMLEAIDKFNGVSGENMKLRIGISSGEVIGAIVGETKFTYDFWSDAVNTASRMESHGEAGRIHCSADFTKEFLRTVNPKDTGVYFTDRGEMEIKGKGTMRTYFLERVE
jgi:class 3 adenylate cyclase